MDTAEKVMNNFHPSKVTAYIWTYSLKSQTLKWEARDVAERLGVTLARHTPAHTPHAQHLWGVAPTIKKNILSSLINEKEKCLLHLYA